MTNPVKELAAGPGAELLAIAEKAIRQALEGGPRWEPDLEDVDPDLTEPGASFVTLVDADDSLLGCIGSLEARRALACDVAEHAVQAAFDDPRFSGLGADQFARMTIEISILSSLEAMRVGSRADLLEQLRPGHDGLVVAAGGSHATFLPAVWDKISGADEFVDLLWRKAGLARHSWPPGLGLHRYTTRVFEASGPRASPDVATETTGRRLRWRSRR